LPREEETYCDLKKVTMSLRKIDFFGGGGLGEEREVTNCKGPAISPGPKGDGGLSRGSTRISTTGGGTPF